MKHLAHDRAPQAGARRPRRWATHGRKPPRRTLQLIGQVLLVLLCFLIMALVITTAGSYLPYATQRVLPQATSAVQP